MVGTRRTAEGTGMDEDPTRDPIADLERAADERRSELERVSEAAAEGAPVDAGHKTEVEQAFVGAQQQYEEAIAGRAQELTKVWHSLWIDVLKVRLGNRPSPERAEWLVTLSRATGIPEWAIHNVVRQEAAEGDPRERDDPPTAALIERADALAEKQRERFARRRVVARKLGVAEVPPTDAPKGPGSGAGSPDRTATLAP
jgi:hypothetical protein